MKKSHISIIIAAALSGCGSIQRQVDNQYDANSAIVTNRSKDVITENVTSNVSTVQRSKGAWLGGRALPLQADTTLPEIFRQPAKLRFPGRHNLATIAERITKVTGIPVSVKPDVFLSQSAFVTGGAAGAATAPTNGTPLPPLPVPASSLSAGVSSTAVSNTASDFEMNYEGTLAGYLDLLCARAGISWEYREGVISLHRLVTRVFTLKAIPGDAGFNSSIGKSADSKAGAGQTSSGFNSASTVKMESKFSVWDSLGDAIKSMLSPAGRVAMSQATGNITVTDTRDVIDQVARLVDKENANITRQVSMRVEVLSVRLNNASQYGIDWDIVFNQLSNAYQVRMSSPASLVSAATGNLGFSILAPTTPGTGTTTQQRFGGSQAFFSALNNYGRVSVVTTANAVTLNRQPVPVAITNQTAYLAETTPAPAGALGTTGGTPGLKPGVVTTGFLLNLLPTVLDSNSILLQFSLGISDLVRLKNSTSGIGASQSSIETPEVSSTEFLQRVAIRPGETLVLAGYERAVGQYDRRTLSEGAPVGVGGSFNGANNREAVVILVTPVLSDGAI